MQLIIIQLFLVLTSILSTLIIKSCNAASENLNQFGISCGINPTSQIFDSCAKDYNKTLEFYTMSNISDSVFCCAWFKFRRCLNHRIVLYYCIGATKETKDAKIAHVMGLEKYNWLRINPADCESYYDNTPMCWTLEEQLMGGVISVIGGFGILIFICYCCKQCCSGEYEPDVVVNLYNK